MAMIPEGNRSAHIDRFSGFQELYDRHRPEAPPLVIRLLTDYLGRRPGLVVDLGCGTGLSAFPWLDAADRILGVEPGDGMRRIALAKRAAIGSPANIEFVPGYSNRLGLPDGCADIVTCSQSFHWMEPSGTLREAARVLAPGGLFAAYDCDWPPVLTPSVETAYRHLIGSADAWNAAHAPQEQRAVKWNKDGHLSRMEASGHFAFVREVVFHHLERCDAERYVGLTLSQGGVQQALKLEASGLEDEIAAYRERVERHFAGQTLEILFPYRLRLGITPS